MSANAPTTTASGVTGLDCTAHTGPRRLEIADDGSWRALRGHNLGASESAGLLLTSTPDAEDEEDLEAVSPYQTAYELFALKSGLVSGDEDEQRNSNNRTRWGQVMEPVIAEQIAIKNGWAYRKPEGYYLHPHIDRMACSLDYEVDTDGSGRFVPYEIKNVAASESWKWRNSVGEWIVPAWIQIQAQHQMAVTGCPRVIIGVLFGGNEDRSFELVRDPELIQTIEDAVEAFWAAVDAGEAPEPDYDRDAWVIKRLYSKIDPDPDSILDWRGQNSAMAMAQEMKHHAAQANHHRKEADRLRCELQHNLGGAQAAYLSDELLVVASEVAGTQVNYYRKPYVKLDVKAPRKKHSGRSVAAVAASKT